MKSRIDIFQDKLQKLLSTLIKNPQATCFLEPYQGDSQYDQVIKTKMDLKTVQNRLQRGKYKFVGDMFKDLQLIWRNCQFYNQEGSEIWEQSVFMEKLANSLRLSLEKDIQKEKQPKKMALKSKKHKMSLVQGFEIKNKQIYFQHINFVFLRNRQSDGTQRIKLLYAIEHMDQDELLQCMNLLAEYCPDSLEKNEGQVYINTAKMDSKICEQIMQQIQT